MTEKVAGIIGVGRLGAAVAAALLADPARRRLLVTPRNQARVQTLKQGDDRVVVAEPAGLVRACDLILIALGPGAARQVLPQLSFAPRHDVISLMAEIGLDELKGLVKGAGNVSRLLALPSVAHGRQTLPVYPSTPAVKQLFGADHDLVELTGESDLTAYWSITGLLSSVMMMGEVAAAWMTRRGIPGPLAHSYAASLLHDVSHAVSDGLLNGTNAVSTPGGLNVMARRNLEATGFASRVGVELDRIYARLDKATGASAADTDREVGSTHMSGSARP